jgi:hypothetical protein
MEEKERRGRRRRGRVSACQDVTRHYKVLWRLGAKQPLSPAIAIWALLDVGKHFSATLHTQHAHLKHKVDSTTNAMCILQTSTETASSYSDLSDVRSRK